MSRSVLVLTSILHPFALVAAMAWLIRQAERGRWGYVRGWDGPVLGLALCIGLAAGIASFRVLTGRRRGPVATTLFIVGFGGLLIGFAYCSAMWMALDRV